jgi:hypothetical protein
VGWVNVLDGTALAPLQVFNAVPEPSFEGTLRLKMSELAQENPDAAMSEY